MVSRVGALRNPQGPMVIILMIQILMLLLLLLLLRMIMIIIIMLIILLIILLIVIMPRWRLGTEDGSETNPPGPSCPSVEEAIQA